MKLINHHKNNFYELDGSIMRGTIEMTEELYNQLFFFLKNKYYRAIRDNDTYIREGLCNLIQNKYNKTSTSSIKNRFCVGTTATKIIAEQLNLKNYKQVNYGIKITK